MSEDDHSSGLNVATFRIVKISGYPYLFYLSWLLNSRSFEPTSTGLYESEVDPGADLRQRFEQDPVASNGEIMRESKKRKVHLPEFKAKVGLEALRGFKTINEIGLKYGHYAHPAGTRARLPGGDHRPVFPARAELADQPWHEGGVLRGLPGRCPACPWQA